MQPNENPLGDILSSFEIETEKSIQNKELFETIPLNDISSLETFPIQAEENLKETPQNIIENKSERKTVPIKQPSKIVSGIFFLIRYVTTSGIIFVILLVTTNYSAYYSLAKGYFFSDSLQKNNESLISSVEAGNISLSDEEYQEKAKELDAKPRDQHSIRQLIASRDDKNIGLDIDITPYENRIVIPKLGKNIPLLDIKQQTVSGHSELEDIFMQELEKGVIRYPGSAKPGDVGNTFIFGHSSNFPWIPGEYNDVFAMLDYLEAGDKIIVYYKQKIFTYEVGEKTVIKPGDVSVLKADTKDSELSVMTCWPVGTTLERLVVNAKLVSQK